MPLLALILVVAVATTVAAAVAWRYPRRAPGAMAVDVADAAGHAVARHGRLRAFVERRRDPVEATGIALTLALAAVVGGGGVIAALAAIVRSNPSALALDSGAARWGHAHETARSDDVLGLLTHLGDGLVVTALAVLLAAVETWRIRSRWAVPFLLAVTLGNHLATVAIKELEDRARPTLNPIAATLGPSFPSGHTSTAAAFFAAAALLLGRRRGHMARTALAAAAVGIAVLVASTRVLLGVHWASDVVAGLALGWGWFALCAIAFGGRLLRFGATAERARETTRRSAAPLQPRGVRRAASGDDGA